LSTALSRDSKPIKKSEDEAMDLIIEALEGRDTHGFNVDSIFFNKSEGWVVIEFLKCVGVRPHESHPNRYWGRVWRKVTALWTLTQKLSGNFYWVTYEHSREQFSILHVTNVDRDKGITAQRIDTDMNGFKKWYNNLNDNPGPLW
jgi:hypothetical protein